MMPEANIFDNDDARQKARAWANVHQENRSFIKQNVKPDLDQESENEAEAENERHW